MSSKHKRDEIRSKVLEQIMGATPSGGSERASLPRVKAHIAVVGEQVKEGLAARVERLEAEREAGMVQLRLDPELIGPSEFANRDTASLSPEDPDFQRLVEGIRSLGQHSPIRIRPSAEGRPLPYEIVFGHRRHAACKLLNAETEGGFPVLAVIDSAAVDRKRLVTLMHSENAEHYQLSPYELGTMYRSWLDAGIYENQDGLSRDVGLSQPTVSSYLRVAELPEEVLNAFGDRRTISMRWMQDLSKALKTNSAAVLAAARDIAGQDPRPAPQAVLRALIAFPSSDKRRSAARKQTVTVDGRVACRITRRDGRMTLNWENSIVDRATQKALTEDILELVETRLATKRPRGRP